MFPTAGITELLIDWSKGNDAAQEMLFPLVEKELHRLAHHYLRKLNSGNTLQTTAVINEAYIRLVDQSRVQWQNRAHFYGIAAIIMRRILVNHIRDRQSQKRGGANHFVEPLEESTAFIGEEKSSEILALEQALCRLYEWDARKGKIVELRYYGGLTVEETAEFLGISRQTVMRDWDVAKAWIAREISK